MLPSESKNIFPGFFVARNDDEYTGSEAVLLPTLLTHQVSVDDVATMDVDQRFNDLTYQPPDIGNIHCCRGVIVDEFSQSCGAIFHLNEGKPVSV
jgi:hypothetical protein